jgi:hypothetical protein
MYDRKGNPLSEEEGLKVFESDRTVAKTTLSDGTLVSTAHLVLDHGWGGKPLIFETMVFPTDTSILLEDAELSWRYATEDEARANHELLCAALQGVIDAQPG